MSCCFCLLLTCIFIAYGDSYYPVKPLYFARPKGKGGKRMEARYSLPI